MVAAVVILFFVLLSVTLFLEIRYGILNPFPYKRIKYSALYDSNFWKTFVASNKEQGFIVRSQPKTPLTDYVIRTLLGMRPSVSTHCPHFYLS